MAQADTRVRKIDQNFPLPAELQFASYDEDTPNVLVGDDAEGTEVDSDIIIDSSDDTELDEDEISDDLDTPLILGIVSQTVRTAKDGRTVVDLVLSVEDVFGSVKYEVRTTKI